MTNDELLALVLERLDPLPVTARSMFGLKGMFHDGRFFGIITDGVLYFRTDEESRGEYLERGMPAFQPKYRPRGPKTVDRNFEVPAEVLADETLLKEWALRAARAER